MTSDRPKPPLVVIRSIDTTVNGPLVVTWNWEKSWPKA